MHVLHRERKEGLGPAYLAGFRRALELGADLVFEMDCDFSHDPADVPRLAAAAEERAISCSARATCAGGGTRNWGLVRRFISRGGSLYAQVLLQLGIRDLTGGFKCYRRAVLETIDLDAIDSRGYAFQIETTYRAIRAGFRVVEVPITFADREVGGSKMSKAIVLEAIWKVPALRLRALRQPSLRAMSGAWHRTASTGRWTRVACRSMREITDETFEAEVLQADRPVVIDFWAPWCGPCKAVEPILADLAETHAGTRRFVKLNIDENPVVASRYGVLAIPTAILFEGGEARETVVGARSRSHYEEAWAPWLSPRVAVSVMLG